MLVDLHPGSVPVTFPVWADASAWKETPAYSRCSLVLAGRTGAIVKVTAYPGAGTPEQVICQLASGVPRPFVPSRPWTDYSVIEVQRIDTKASLPASAAFRTW